MDRLVLEDPECGPITDLGMRAIRLLNATVITPDDRARARGGAKLTAVLVEGSNQEVAFEQGKLDRAREPLRAFLREVLPEEFYEAHGGASVEGLQTTRDGQVWACEHVAGGLLCLCLALREARFCIADRSSWSLFPKGKPFVVFSKPGERFVNVHVMLHGRTLCGFPSVTVNGALEWPPNHQWTRIEDRQNVTCLGCRVAMGRVLTMPPASGIN